MIASSKTSEVQGRIVNAATALFSRQGYHGTSTREIARLADVSEVTVFRYFNHKDEIFWSALSSSLGAIRPRLESFNRSAKAGAPEVVLPQMISLLFDIATFSPEIVRLIAIAFLELRGNAEDVCREHLTPLFNAICGYLAANVGFGKLRDLDPAIVTVALAMTVVAQPEMSKLVNGSGLSHLGGRKAIDQYSEFWKKVLIPSPVGCP